MKNKTIKVAVVSVFAAIAGYGVYAGQENVGVSDLLLDDVMVVVGDGGEQPIKYQMKQVGLDGWK